MGAKTALFAFADADIPTLLRTTAEPDQELTRQLVRRVHPGRTLAPIEAYGLGYSTYPADDIIYASVQPGLDVFATGEYMIDYPSRLPEHVLAAARRSRIVVHFMHSVVDWLAFAVWDNGVLVRSLSLSPDSGIMENIGEPFDWEAPYWAGARPVHATLGEEPYPLPFHPLSLGEKALRALFGFVMDSAGQEDDIDPFAVPMLGFRLGS